MDTTVIDLSLISNSNVGVEVWHNDLREHIVTTNKGNIRLTFDLHQANNTFIIKNTSNEEITIDYIKIFGLGEAKLKYLGIVTSNELVYPGHIIAAGSSWALEYKYPVFSWLHKILNFGWIIGKND